jgi:hypothetical protein
MEIIMGRNERSTKKTKESLSYGNKNEHTHTSKGDYIVESKNYSSVNILRQGKCNDEKVRERGWGQSKMKL